MILFTSLQIPRVDVTCENADHRKRTRYFYFDYAYISPYECYHHHQANSSSLSKSSATRGRHHYGYSNAQNSSNKHKNAQSLKNNAQHLDQDGGEEDGVNAEELLAPIKASASSDGEYNSFFQELCADQEMVSKSSSQSKKHIYVLISCIISFFFI